MYGTNEDPAVIRTQQFLLLQENAIPSKYLLDKDYMDDVKKCFSMNFNIPGTIENEHPHRFIKGLRPLEDFPHTPLIPISEK
jgi:hypothetical protein